MSAADPVSDSTKAATGRDRRCWVHGGWPILGQSCSERGSTATQFGHISCAWVNKTTDRSSTEADQ